MAMAISEPLKTQLYFDTILYKDRSVIRITIPSQKKVSFVGKKAYKRNGASTVEVTDHEQIIAIYEIFQR
jgi:NAD kinase